MNNIKDCEMIPITELLSEIIDNRGKTCPTEESGFPLIATNCIKHSSIYPTFENIRFVSDDTLKNWFRAELKPNDILFVNKGTPGKVCLVPNPVTFCAAQDMVGLRVNPEKIYYKYLFTVLRSDFIQEKIKNFHVGIAIPHFKKSDMHNLLIPVPKMDIQIKIGDTYCELSEKIENNNAMNNELESLAKTLYDYWFLQFEFPNEDGKPYKSSGGKMVWNEELKREIPEGWDCSSISEISSRVKVGFVGTVDKYYCEKSQGVPIIRPAEMQFDGINYDALRYVTSEFHNKNKKSQIHKGDVLISRCGKDGIPNIYELDEEAQVLNAVIIEPNKTVADSIFITETLKSPYVQKQIMFGTSGSVQGVINTAMIASIILPFNKEICKMYVDRMIGLYSMITSLRKENRELASLRDFLLPLLMNGQVGFKEEE